VKKKLIAAAVVSAFAAPVAFAQTAPANVTIYGTLQTEFISVSGDGSGGRPDFQRRNRIGSPGSFFIGFRGSENLGGGLRVIWQVEQNVGSGDGTGTANTWGSRNTFAGLAGGFGQVMLGNHDSPMKRVLGINNVMNMGLTGPNGMEPVMTNNGATARFSNRISNSLTYISPTMSGFRVEAQYQANEDKTNTNVGVQSNPHEMGVALQYAGGPFRAGIAYSQHNDLRGAGLDDDAILVSGSWTSGPLLVHAAYSRLAYQAVAGGDTKRDNFMIGAQYSLGMHRFRAQYQNAGDVKGTATGAAIGTLASAGGDTGGQVYGLSYGYALSKRSEVYALYSYINNENNGLVNHSGSHGAAGAFTAGMDVTAYGVGIRHSF
jgi:predicted porin